MADDITWLRVADDFVKSGWSPIVAGVFAWAATWFSISKNRFVEHIQWRRGALEKIGIEFAELAYEQIERATNRAFVQIIQPTENGSLKEEFLRSSKKFHSLSDRALLLSEYEISHQIGVFLFKAFNPKNWIEATEDDLMNLAKDLHERRRVVIDEIAERLWKPEKIPDRDA